MRVPGHSIGTVETRASETARREVGEASESASTASTPKTGEAVVTGSRSQDIKASSERAESARAQKLERIAAQLADGSYQVDFAAVAGRLIDDELSRTGASGER
jgi:flagellar biosynthesis anti-sigma factor FlgM